jgi:hypothetical protein
MELYTGTQNAAVELGMKCEARMNYKPHTRYVSRTSIGASGVARYLGARGRVIKMAAPNRNCTTEKDHTYFNFLLLG